MDIATDLMINEEIRDREVRLIDENAGRDDHPQGAGAGRGKGS